MFTTIYYLLALIFILTIHEFSHAWVARRLGDPTADRAGRVSLNPLVHLDLLGTIMLFLAGIGWGKPVPVDPRNFKNPKRDEALTALAGPMANLFLAVLAAIPLSYGPGDGVFNAFSEAVMTLSLVLFIFNMLPFPPLDGSKFFGIFVPDKYYGTYHEFLRKSLPFFLIFVLADIYLFPHVFNISIVWTVVSTLTFWLQTAIMIVV